MDLPTRSEMDDVHKTLHELKREGRRLKRQRATAEKAGKAPASRLKMVAVHEEICPYSRGTRGNIEASARVR